MHHWQHIIWPSVSIYRRILSNNLFRNLIFSRKPHPFPELFAGLNISYPELYSPVSFCLQEVLSLLQNNLLSILAIRRYLLSPMQSSLRIQRTLLLSTKFYRTTAHHFYLPEIRLSALVLVTLPTGYLSSCIIQRHTHYQNYSFLSPPGWMILRLILLQKMEPYSPTMPVIRRLLASVQLPTTRLI